MNFACPILIRWILCLYCEKFSIWSWPSKMIFMSHLGLNFVWANQIWGKTNFLFFTVWQPPESYQPTKNYKGLLFLAIRNLLWKNLQQLLPPYSALSTTLFDYRLAIYWRKHIGTESFARKIGLVIGPCQYSITTIIGT